MTIPPRLANRTARGAILHRYFLQPGELSESERCLEPSTPELSFRIFAAFRAHLHISDWMAIAAIRAAAGRIKAPSVHAA